MGSFLPWFLALEANKEDLANSNDLLPVVVGQKQPRMKDKLNAVRGQYVSSVDVAVRGEILKYT